LHPCLQLTLKKRLFGHSLMDKHKQKQKPFVSPEHFWAHLSEITALSLKQSSVPDLYQLLANQMHDLLFSDTCYITLWDDQNQETIPIAASGDEGKQYAQSGGKPGELTMTYSCIRAGKPLVAEDVFNTPYLNPKIAEKYPTRSLLALPLIVDNEKLGAVLVGFNKSHKFTKKEIEYGNLAANQIALVVHKARLMEQLVNKQNELVKTNHEKDKLLSIIGHDLKSPFTALLALTRVIRDKTSVLTYDEMRDHASSIENSARGIYSLLENLLEWSHVQGGTMKFDPECIFLDKIVRQCIEMHQASALHKNIAIKTEIPPRMIIVTDQRMFYSLLGNLISNSLKFTSPGGQINISAQMLADRTILISVADTGRGMQKKQVDTLFGLEKSPETSTGTEGELGSGIGLRLCKEFIDKHKGKIWAESQPGKGSTFFISFPYPDVDCASANTGHFG